MTAACRNVYNFAPSFAYFVPNYIGKILTRDYNKDTINLSDISVHNGIEHDASLCRASPPSSLCACDATDAPCVM